MTPAVQHWVAIVVVIAAALYLSWRNWRARRAATAARQSAGCGPGCGCG